MLLSASLWMLALYYFPNCRSCRLNKLKLVNLPSARRRLGPVLQEKQQKLAKDGERRKSKHVEAASTSGTCQNLDTRTNPGAYSGTTLLGRLPSIEASSSNQRVGRTHKRKRLNSSTYVRNPLASVSEEAATPSLRTCPQITDDGKKRVRVLLLRHMIPGPVGYWHSMVRFSIELCSHYSDYRITGKSYC